MRRYSKEGLIAAGLLSAAAFALGDLWAAALRSLEGPWLQNVGAAMEAGMTGFISKPLDVNYLYQTLMDSLK